MNAEESNMEEAFSVINSTYQNRVKQMEKEIMCLRQAVKDRQAKIERNDQQICCQEKELQEVELRMKKTVSDNARMLQHVNDFSAALALAKEKVRERLMQQMDEIMNIFPDVCIPTPAI